MNLTQLLICSMFLVLFIGALWRPIFGILGYISVYLLYNPDAWWGSVIAQYLPRPSFTAMAVLIIASIIHIKRLNWSFSRRELELYIFLGLIWLSSFVFGIGVQQDNWIYITKMTKLFVFIFLFIRIVNSLSDYKLVVWVFILSVLFLSYQCHSGSASYFYDGRLEFLGGMDFGESNGIAALSALTVMFLGIEMLRASCWKKAVYIFGIALITDTIVLTQSRGVFLGLFMVVPYIILGAPKAYRKTIYASAVLAVILFFILINKSFITRMNTISDELQYTEEEQLSRLDFWRASIWMFKDHPFGVGIKNFEKLVPNYDPRNKGMDAHNTYVLCYSEIGILGIALFLIIIVEAFLQLRRIRLMVKNVAGDEEIILYSLALGGGLLVYLTGYGMTHSAIYTEILWILLSMPICLENASQKLLSQ